MKKHYFCVRNFKKIRINKKIFGVFLFLVMTFCLTCALAETNETVSDSGIVVFGNYWQEDAVTKTPIEWIVLDTQGDKKLLLCKNVLDVQPYDSKATVNVTWERCSLRNWLNNTFFYNAFSETEQDMICNTTVNNGNGQGYESYGNLYPSPAGYNVPVELDQQ